MKGRQRGGWARTRARAPPRTVKGEVGGLPHDEEAPLNRHPHVRAAAAAVPHDRAAPRQPQRQPRLRAAPDGAERGRGGAGDAEVGGGAKGCEGVVGAEDEQHVRQLSGRGFSIAIGCGVGRSGGIGGCLVHSGVGGGDGGGGCKRAPPGVPAGTAHARRAEAPQHRPRRRPDPPRPPPAPRRRSAPPSPRRSTPPRTAGTTTRPPAAPPPAPTQRWQTTPRRRAARTAAPARARRRARWRAGRARARGGRPP
jgi:hypothetical protein